jgi:hypothetical protein
LHECFAVGRQQQPVSIRPEQWPAEIGFKPLQLVRNRRLRPANLPRRLGNLACLYDSDEGPKEYRVQIEIHCTPGTADHFIYLRESCDLLHRPLTMRSGGSRAFA